VSDNDTVKASAEASVEFGANEWLVDELWTLYQKDPELVEKSWWPLFESRAAEAGTPLPAPAPAPHRDPPATPVVSMAMTPPR
jgi:2-oxoglutarate decarboxylase